MGARPVNFRTLDLNLLRVFDAVMVERNVTRAATRLAMTQPAVSNALRRLRDATRQDLFVSSSTGMTPTAHAQTLWPVVRSSLEGLRGAFEPQAFDARVDARSFALAMTDATASLFVPRLLEQLREEQSKVVLNLVALAPPDPRHMLEHGQADVAVGFFPDMLPPTAAEFGSDAIRGERLYPCEYVAVMRRDHPLAAPGALTLDAYCDAQHLRVSMAGKPSGFIGEALSRLGRERHVVVTVNHFFMAGSVVHQSDLLTVLPRSFVPATGFGELLATRPLPFSLPPIEISLLWHRRDEQDAAQRWLRERLVRAAAAISRELPARVDAEPTIA